MKSVDEIPTNAVMRFWSKVEIKDPYLCWDYAGMIGSNGYGQFSIYTKPYLAHRISYAISVGPILDGLYVCHKCDRKVCVNPNHLFLGTPLDNMQDRDRKGRGPQGKRNGRAKLLPEQVEEIRSAYSSGGVLMKDLASKYGVGKSTVFEIIRHKIWKGLNP